MAAGDFHSNPCLPADINKKVEAIKQARKLQELPWTGMQLKACHLQRHQLQEGSVVQGIDCSAVDEIDRCTLAAYIERFTSSRSQCATLQSVSVHIDRCWLTGFVLYH